MLPARLLRHRLAAAAASSWTRSPLRFVAAMSSSASAHGGAGKPNRLAAEHSPYLLQHAHNPVSDATPELTSVSATVYSLRDFDEHLAVARSLNSRSTWILRREENLVSWRRGRAMLWISVNF
jgi:hypothetical protein